jgi:hypothetical protein
MNIEPHLAMLGQCSSGAAVDERLRLILGQQLAGLPLDPFGLGVGE